MEGAGLTNAFFGSFLVVRFPALLRFPRFSYWKT